MPLILNKSRFSEFVVRQTCGNRQEALLFWEIWAVFHIMTIESFEEARGLVSLCRKTCCNMLLFFFSIKLRLLFPKPTFSLGPTHEERHYLLGSQTRKQRSGGSEKTRGRDLWRKCWHLFIYFYFFWDVCLNFPSYISVQLCIVLSFSLNTILLWTYYKVIMYLHVLYLFCLYLANGSSLIINPFIILAGQMHI